MKTCVRNGLFFVSVSLRYLLQQPVPQWYALPSTTADSTATQMGNLVSSGLGQVFCQRTFSQLYLDFQCSGLRDNDQRHWLNVLLGDTAKSQKVKMLSSPDKPPAQEGNKQQRWRERRNQNHLHGKRRKTEDTSQRQWNHAPSWVFRLINKII